MPIHSDPLPHRAMRRLISLPLALGLCGLLLLLSGADAAITRAQASGEAPATFFVDVTSQAGLPAGRQGRDRAIGQAWGDVDNDGWQDLYLTDTAGPNLLYRNQQDGTFAPFGPGFSRPAALADAYSGGASFADYDNDGWTDLYVVNWGANALLRNDAGRGFVDVTAAAGVGDLANGQTASWGDYDADGWLDLYVANWSCYPRCGRPQTGDRDRLYHNNGDGTFSDATALLGTRTSGAGFVASFVDYDNDGDLDIYLVNDEFINPIGNVLWRNDGPGCDGWCFVDVAPEANANTRLMGMGLATADYDDDGDFDFYFSNAGPMVLLENLGDGSFRDVAPGVGVALPSGIGWGTVFFDFNNDGFDDLYVAIMEGVGGRDGANPLFRNNGHGQFNDVGRMSGVDNNGRTLGVAFADYDRDGWLDLVIGNYDAGYHLYRNQTGRLESNHWLAFELQGAGPINRDAVGARVYVTANGKTQLQAITNGGSLGAGNALALHFGLGDASAAEMVRIVWPDGSEEAHYGVAADQAYSVTYGTLAALGETKPLAMLPVLGFGLAGAALLIAVLAPLFAWAGGTSPAFWRR